MQTMKRAVFFFLSAALFALCARAEVLPSKGYVVANSDDPDSLAIADFYASARGIPKGNIVGLPMPKAGKISKAEYFEKIENPLVAELAKRGALKAVKLGGREPSGREIYSYVSHDIGFLVLCRGVPWGVNPSPNSPAPNPPKSFSDAASVDSELSGRFVSSKKLAGFLKNPLFNNYSWGMTPSIAGVIPVARLDGAARADAEGLVKSAIEAEKRGIAGRVYIDKSKREKTGDRWLDAAAKILSAAGFDVSENSEPGLFGCADRMDAPAFYFGWYTFRPCGYFAEKGFSFPRGASALHIYSFSASDMRNAANWTPAFVSKGAAAVFGNVYEPYLGGTHHPHVYALALARGMSSGEAATAAMPFLSWQGVFVGDPLFKPFKTGLDAQMRAIDSGSADALSQYSVIRVMNRIAREKARRRRSISARSTSENFPTARCFGSSRRPRLRRVILRNPSASPPARSGATSIPKPRTGDWRWRYAAISFRAAARSRRRPRSSASRACRIQWSTSGRWPRLRASSQSMRISAKSFQRR